MQPKDHREKLTGTPEVDPGHAAPLGPVLRFPVLRKHLGSLSNMQMWCGVRNKLLIEGLGDPLRNTCHRSIGSLACHLQEALGTEPPGWERLGILAPAPGSDWAGGQRQNEHEGPQSDCSSSELCSRHMVLNCRVRQNHLEDLLKQGCLGWKFSGNADAGSLGPCFQNCCSRSTHLWPGPFTLTATPRAPVHLASSVCLLSTGASTPPKTHNLKPPLFPPIALAGRPSEGLLCPGLPLSGLPFRKLEKSKAFANMGKTHSREPRRSSCSNLKQPNSSWKISACLRKI